MKILSLEKIQNPFLTSTMAAEALGVQRASAKLACHRYVKNDLLLRLKRDLYVTSRAWERFREEDFFMAANRLQVPAYISFTTALSYYQITSQIQQGFVESAATVRSWSRQVGGVQFKYMKLLPAFYAGFIKRGQFFIATPEKALLDALYLMTLGRYRLDLSAVDWEKLDAKKTVRQSKIFPPRSRNRMLELWKH